MWKHNRMEVVELCCNLLNAVMKKHPPQATRDVPGLVYLLFRIAFRHKIPGVRARADLFLPETLEKLAALVRHGDTEFINDLSSAFISISWHENQRHHIVWTALNIPATLLSPTLQSALVPLFGTVRWSLVEKVDRKELAGFVGKLPVEEIVQHIVEDRIACVGWMRLLLFTIFRPPRETDTRPLWKILLSALPKIPHFFSRDLLDYVNPSEITFPHSSGDYDSEVSMKEEEPLWMILFWSSRFFEMDCKPWSDFRDATVRLGQRKPALLERLEKFCFGLEEEAQAGPNPRTVRTKAFTEMVKVEQRVDSQNLTSQGTLASNAVRTRNLADTGETDPLRLRRVAPKAARPRANHPPPPVDEGSPNQSAKLPRIAPQDTPRSDPVRPRQDAITRIQVVRRQNSLSVEWLHPPPVRRTLPPPLLPLQERSESPTLTDRLSYLSTHSGSTEFLDVTSQSRLLPGGAILPWLLEARNSEDAGFHSLSFWMRRREEGYFEDAEHSPRPLQAPQINPTRQNITWPSNPLTVAPRDTPPASRTTRRQSSILSQIQYGLPAPFTTSGGPSPSLLRQRQPPPPLQVRSESPIPINDDGDQQPPVQSGSGVN